MASNSSSVFNETPTETKPAVAADASLMASSPTSSASPTSVSAVGTAASSTATATTTTTHASESGKQAAPKMEAVIDERDANASSSSSSASSLATGTGPSLSSARTLSVDASTGHGKGGMRFARVSPAGLDEMKTSLTFRKSCLKRSTSSLPASFSVVPCGSPRRVSNGDAVAVPHATVVVEETQPDPAFPVQKNRRRCWECKAKIGLTAVTCRCDYTFCNKHRYAEEHKCRFNFKRAAKRQLEAENPCVVPAKVARIN